MEMSGCLTERHLMLFGTIVQWFARYEVLMQEVMATALGSDSAAVMLLTRSLAFGDKRRALLSLLRHRRVPRDQFDAVHAYLEIPHTFNMLCDDIKHAGWIAGTSPNSIQPDWILRPAPTVRPMRMAADTVAEDFLTDEDERQEYTLDSLAEAAETLGRNYELLSGYVGEVGLIERRMDEAASSRRA
jgi:hypothetical protein